MDQICNTRARLLQLRAWQLFKHGYTVRLAEGTGYTREYVSKLLNEQVPLSEEAAAKIDAFLCEQESAPTAAAA
jgi:hypothetical protein